MHRPERFEDGPQPAELPDLPIPRPGEGAAEHAPPAAPIAPPRLGGGASFTAVSGDEAPVPAPTPVPEDVGLIEYDRARLETERFTWSIAAQLTAGMLANPDRNHASVKDAMAMFDQFLQEMHAYSRIASEFDITGDRDRRRRDHTEYFQGPVQGAPQPAAQAEPSSPAPLPNAVPLPEPMQPRPAAGYQPLPPGARSFYVPGSMAGAPPDPTGDVEEDAA